jgi:sulfur carrier protein ThiS
LETGVYETFTPEKVMTVADLLKELNLEGKYFGILVNGKKAEPETKISPEDQIVVLPHIAGGL